MSEFLMRPFFCLDQLEEEIPTAFSGQTYVSYRDVKENEFFFMDKDSFEKMNELKEKLFEKYVTAQTARQ